MELTNTQINNNFLRLNKRAESNKIENLVATFVDSGSLFTILSSLDHQIIYGRRGTGKTHALIYLEQTLKKKGDIPVFIDLRRIGSSGGVYADSTISLSERATRLLIDTMEELHNILLSYVLNAPETLVDLSVLGPLLDKLAESISQVNIVGTIEQKLATSNAEEASKSIAFGVNLTAKDGGSVQSTASSEARHTNETHNEVIQKGEQKHTVNFGLVSRSLNDIVSALASARIWILLDEWSSVPQDLQPYLADFFRRSMLHIKGVTVKIAAIEHRSAFQIPVPLNNYIGLELGADIAADINLDDFMVFDSDTKRARHFFQELIYKHYMAASDSPPEDMSAERLVQIAFTQSSVFDEYVRSAEGVPRDAINIIALSAQKASDNKISTNHIRESAKTWYQRDKGNAVKSDAENLLHWIIDKVIGERRTRAFLLQSNTKESLIDYLFDLRLIHILKKGVSAHDQPGIRYDVYKLDYGCYVDLINTSKATQGLLPFDDEINGNKEYEDVPPDDYRSIRRAILDLSVFHSK